MNYEFSGKRQCFDKVVFALTLNRKKMTERIIIGEAGEVRKRLDRNTGDVFYDETRQLGQFLLDFESDPKGDWNINAMALRDSYKKISLSKGIMLKSVKSNADFLRRKYEEGEPSAMFAAISTWENYLRCYYSNHGSEIFIDFTSLLYKPFYIFNEYKAWEIKAINTQLNITHAEESQVELWYPVKKHPFEKIVPIESIVAFSSFMTVIFYYINKINEWGLVYQKCKVCNNYFLTTSKHYELCSDECRKVTAVEAKKQFDERNKGDKTEQIYENYYQYWYNRQRKMKRNNALENEIAMFSEVFRVFRNEAVKKKADVKNGKMKLSEFTSWLVGQQDIVDSLVKHGRG